MARLPHGRSLNPRQQIPRGPKAVSYLVAMPDKVGALALITRQAAKPGDDVEDLGRVSEALITTMRLPRGQFMPINGVRHVTQRAAAQ